MAEKEAGTRLDKVQKAPFWTDPSVRSVVFQVLLLIIVLGFGWYLYKNTSHNLETRNIASGFGFLSQVAGFNIIQHYIPYSQQSSYGTAILVALINTLVVSILGIIFATIIGFTVGIARLSQNWLVAKLATVYVETLRNIPLLLQLFFWYFAVLRSMPPPRQSLSPIVGVFINQRGIYLPRVVPGDGFGLIQCALLIGILGAISVSIWAKRRQMATGHMFPSGWVGLGLIVGLPLFAAVVTGFPWTLDLPALRGFNFRGGFVIIPEFAALLVGISLYTASFIAEVVRGGIQSVSAGQTEAAQALGLRHGLTLRLVVVPQALRVIIPPLTSQYLNLLKNSSLGAAIGYPELVAVATGTVLNQTGQAIEVIALTMSVYLVISLLISSGMNWYNARKALIER